MAKIVATFSELGYTILPWDQATEDWANAALPIARRIAQDPAQRRTWLRHGETWFAGVDVLPNAPDGRIAGRPLKGPAFDLLHELNLWPQHWHQAQISVTYPGYPAMDPGESPGAARYRRTRDAAHIDGLHAIGDARRRMLREAHAFVLGLPLTWADPGAAPLVVWPGSPQVIAVHIGTRLRAEPVETWPHIDLTEIYHQARRAIFETCPRVEITASPGQAILLHRHMLHGIAPWSDAAQAAPEGRMIAYFRPCFDAMGDWLD